MNRFDVHCQMKQELNLNVMHTNVDIANVNTVTIWKCRFFNKKKKGHSSVQMKSCAAGKTMIHANN